MTKRSAGKSHIAAGAALGHAFNDKALLKQALTHPSLEGEANYQRLEFLGDRIIGVVIAEALFKVFPDEPEGKLNRRFAALVRKETLAEIALSLGLASSIRMSETAAKAKGRASPSILADVLEALIGALYIDAGFDTAQAFIEKTWRPLMAAKTAARDAKSALQEWAQGHGLPLPEYTLARQSGPDHAPSFKVTVSVQGKGKASAGGASKKEAETKAAAALFKKITGVRK